jgi:PAS domain S-box-containing protein
MSPSEKNNVPAAGDPAEADLPALGPIEACVWPKALYDSEAVLLWVHALDGTLVAANPSFLSFIGRSPADLGALSMRDILPAAQFERYQKQIEETPRETPLKAELELNLPGKAAERQWVEADLIPIWQGGSVGFILGLAREATLRISGEHALRACKEKYSALFSNAPDIMVVVDFNGHVVEINDKFEAEFGRKRLEVIGKDLASGRLFSRESAERFQLYLKEIREGQPRVLFEVLGKTHDGRKVPLEVHAVPIQSAGLVPAVLASIRNIEERKQKEEALANSEETSRVLLSAVLGAAYLIDTRGFVLAANSVGAARFGLTPPEMVDHPLTEFLDPEAAVQRRERGLEVIRTAKPACFEDIEDGATYENWIHPICDDEGRVIKLAIYSRDVTEERKAREERRKLTAQLQQAQKMEAIGTLAGGIAHDFNNLLMAIQGNVSLMQFDMDAAHPYSRILGNIEKLVRSGADLTSKLLGYARKGRYETKPLVINDLVRDTSETFGRMRKDISIYRDLSEDIRGILADRGQIEQVLLNLLVNAADAMPSGGRITLKTRNASHQEIPYKGYSIKPGQYVMLTVSDTGSGMEPTVMARIFEPFFTTKQMGRGTGLGLASAYGIVKGHNGYIDVASEVGKGSTFFIYFPATDRRSAEIIENALATEMGQGTLLLVDDEITVLDVTAEMLEKLGYTVLKARNGPEAIDTFRRQRDRIRMVILDMVMPEMGGGDVFDELRSLDPQVRVLLASGFSLQGQAKQIMQRGCSGFIQKPFSMEDLSVKLRLILNE